MPTEAKKAAVAALKEDLSSAKATIVADYRGLTVSEISAVRRVLRGEGIKYRVVKNRLAKIAAQDAGNPELVGLLQGPTALAISGGDEVALARSFLEAIRPFKTVTVRGAVLSGKMVDASSVTRLASLPSREVLLGQLAGGMAAPLANMVSLLAAPLRNFGYALTQLMGIKGAAEAAAAPKAEAPKAEAPKAAAPKAEAVAAPAETEAPAEESTAEAATETTAEAATETTAEAATETTAEAAAEAPEAEAEPEAPQAEAATETADEPTADSEPAAEPTDSNPTTEKES